MKKAVLVICFCILTMVIQVYASDSFQYEENIILNTDGNGHITKIKVKMPFEECVLSTASTEYNPELSYYLACLSRSIYASNNVVQSYKNLGFSDTRECFEDSVSQHLSGYYVGSKTLVDGTKLVLITIRGSVGYEWNNMLNMGEAILGFGKYEAFVEDAERIYDVLSDYLGGIKTSKVIYVITGHSQGAAAGNLLADLLYQSKVPISAVYDYNFACPDVACLINPNDWNPGGDHDNIFNIGNVEDPVTFLPGHLVENANVFTHWGKFGRSYWFMPDAYNHGVDGHDMGHYTYALSFRAPISAFFRYEQIPIATVKAVLASATDTSKNPIIASASTWKCPGCGADASGYFCSNCGTQRPVSEWDCPTCGAKTTGNFCSNCGTARDAADNNPDIQSSAMEQKPAKTTAHMDFVSSDASGYPGVKLYFEYTDDNNQPITLYSMTGNVKESIAGGAEIERTVRNIERLAGNQGLSIDIVADKSGSMESDLPHMQQIMDDFVTSLDYGLGDQVEILSFDSYVMYMCTYTQDVSWLRNGIYSMAADGGTALYDALMTGVINASGRAGARCVIGFTDGEDNESIYTAQEVISLALQREVPVYLIGTSSADSNTLEYICSQTGGNYWDIDSIFDIGQILQTIYSKQKDMYCLEYVSDPGADPYAQRMVSCTLEDDTYCGTVTDLNFQATPIMTQAAHTSRYEIIHSDVSWNQANDDCVSRGGHLATISSQAEMDQLTSMCESEGVKYCWLGGYTSVKNGAAFGHWVTGEPFSFTAWYPGEPSGHDTDGTPEYWLMLWKVEDAWSWNDQREDVFSTGLEYFRGKVGYICEYE